MNKIKEWLKQNTIFIKIRIMVELFYEYNKLTKHLGAINLKNNKNKIEADITIKCHSLRRGWHYHIPKLGLEKKKLKKY